MTNKEKALALAAILDNSANPLAERKAAVAELRALKKQAKTGWDKLGLGGGVDNALAAVEALPEADPLDEDVLAVAEMPQADFDAGVAALSDPLDEPAAAPQPKPKPKSDTKGDQRGLISALVRCELMDTADSYALIVERVKARFPDANTTTRSVASVAADLRRDGVAVASRRPAKGPAA